MGQIGSIFGGSSLGSLLGGGTTPDPSGGGNLAVPGGDVASMDFSQLFDPTGSTNATAAITGNQAGLGPTGAPDVGGQLSDPQTGTQTTPQGPQAPQAPQATPQDTSYWPHGWPGGSSEVATGPFSPTQQPTVPGPTGWTPPQANYWPNGWPSDPAEVAAGTKDQSRIPQQDAGMQPTSAVPYAQESKAGKLPGTAGAVPTADVPDTATPTSGKPASQDATTPPAPAGTTPPARGGAATALPPSTQQTGVAGQGGFPGAGGIGNLISDIQGIMSGNPQSLMKLVQDVMRMGGQPGMGGQQGDMLQQLMGGQMGAAPGTPAGDFASVHIPTDQAAAPWLAQGQPAPPGTNPMNYPQAPPGTRFVPGQGLVDAQGNRVAARTAPGQNNAPAGSPVNPRGVPTVRVGPSGQPTTQLPSGTREAGTQRGLTGGTAAAPSQKPDGSMPTGRTAVTPIIASALRAGGASNNAVQGILFNVGAESSFDPTLRHADQPRFGGEAHYAHGLYQEGGDEWNNYSRWLNGRDWRDPHLQTQFLTANLKQNYPRLWQSMNNARTPEDAAKLFAKDYLRPSAENLMARYNRINRGGVERYAVPPAEDTAAPVPPLQPISQPASTASGQSLLQVPEVPKAVSPSEQLANAAYAARMGRQFNAAYPDWRRSENIEDRRRDTPMREIARSWEENRWETERERGRGRGPRPERLTQDPNNPLAIALGLNDIPSPGPRRTAEQPDV